MSGIFCCDYIYSIIRATDEKLLKLKKFRFLYRNEDVNTHYAYAVYGLRIIFPNTKHTSFV